MLYSGPVARQRLEPIARQCGQIVALLGGVENTQPLRGLIRKGSKLSDPLAREQPLGLAAFERADHRVTILRYP